MEIRYYIPTCYIFIGAEDVNNNVNCKHLLDMCISAHAKANIPISKQTMDSDIKRIVYANKDEAWYWRYQEENSDALPPINLTQHSIKLFFDDALPKDSIWRTIEKLNLKNYIVNIGIYNGKEIW